MGNVIYDFTLGWPITPHIGGGIGAIDVYRSFGATGTATTANGTPINFTTNSFSGSKWGFGYQAIAGVRYLINPALAFDVDYRYLASTKPNHHRHDSAGKDHMLRHHPRRQHQIWHTERRRQLDDDVWRAAASSAAASPAGAAAAADPSGLPGILRLG